MEKLKQLRKQKGISQNTVASAAGISISAYSNIENGVSKSITIDIGKGIAKALGVSFIELFEIDENRTSEKELKISLLSNYILSELSHYSLLTELSAHEKLSNVEKRNYYDQKENLKQGIFKVLSDYKSNNFLSSSDLKELLDLYPTFAMWQNLLEPVKQLL